MQDVIWRRRMGFALIVSVVAAQAGAIEPYQEYRKHIESAQNPTMSLFSSNDLNYAIGQYRRANGWTRNGQFDQSAIVTLPGGRVVEWKVSSYMSSGGTSYLNESYYNDH